MTIHFVKNYFKKIKENIILKYYWYKKPFKCISTYNCTQIIL